MIFTYKSTAQAALQQLWQSVRPLPVRLRHQGAEPARQLYKTASVPVTENSVDRKTSGKHTGQDSSEDPVTCVPEPCAIDVVSENPERTETQPAAGPRQPATHLRSTQRRRRRRGRKSSVFPNTKCRLPSTASSARSRCCSCGGRSSWWTRAAAPRCIRNRLSATPT